MPYHQHLDLSQEIKATMANILKKVASGLFDKLFYSAEVITVKSWTPATMYELVLHFPKADMSRWNAIQRVKCKVGELDFRDYTPANWNAEARCFSLFIAAGHDGAGARWVKKLKTGHQILLSAVYAAPLPANEGKILGLGDSSALAHFLALKQLTDSTIYPMDTAIAFHGQFILPPSLTRLYPEFNFLFDEHQKSLECLTAWLSGKALEEYTSIYLAGNIPMVTSLRKQLKSMLSVKAKIYTHGFWS
jgi:NADPH-dependent ferric siderophore reductase